MSNDIEAKAASRLADKLLTLAQYDPGRRYLEFDPVWYEPADLARVSELTYEYLQLRVQKQKPDTERELVLLAPINAKLDLGSLPIAVLVSQYLGCRFAVWKEYADVKWGESAIIGDTSIQAVCVVLQHVVRHGTTATRIASLLRKKKIDWLFTEYIALFHNDIDLYGDLTVQKSLSQVESQTGLMPSFAAMVQTSKLQRTS